jgi:hypothetical protein
MYVLPPQQLSRKSGTYHIYWRPSHWVYVDATIANLLK